MVEARRRRRPVGFDQLRPATRHGLCRQPANGSPLAQAYRSPGGGDNLFLCSVVALDLKTGAYRWHYQEVPGEEWDYTCTSSIIQADLTINGKPRKVLLHAPQGRLLLRPGSQDRAADLRQELCAGELGQGHRSQDRQADHQSRGALRRRPRPGHAGRRRRPQLVPHGLQPADQAGLFSYEAWLVYALDPNFKPQPFRSNSGWGGYTGDALKKRIELQKEGDAKEKAWLTAWDPVKQKAVWQVRLPRHGNGGVLVTGSDPGDRGHDPPDADHLPRHRRQAAVGDAHAERAGPPAPITYMLDGVQYIAVNGGLGRRRRPDRARRRQGAAPRLRPPAGVQAGRDHEVAADEGR